MRNKILVFVKLFVSSGLIYYLLRQIGIASIWQQLISAKITWIFLGVLIFTVSNVLGSFQWYLLLRNSGVRLRFYNVLRYYYIGLFFNNIFISNMGGDFFRLFYVAKHGQNSSAAISTVFLDRFLGFTMLTILAIFGGIYWFGSNRFAQIWYVLLVLMAGWAFLLLIFFNRRLGNLMRFFLKWFVPEKLLLKLRDIYNLIYNFSRNKKLVLQVFLLSFVIQLIRIFIHFIAGRAVGVHISFVAFLIFIPLIALLASLPISIGGLGVREQSGVLLFQQLGVAMAFIISMEFLAYLLTIVGSLPGILFFIFVDKGQRVIKEKRTDEIF